MKKQIDGNIRIEINPEEDVNYIENYINKLPPDFILSEARRVIFKLYWNSTKKSLRLVENSLEKIDLALRKRKNREILPKLPVRKPERKAWVDTWEFIKRQSLKDDELTPEDMVTYEANYEDCPFTLHYLKRDTMRKIMLLGKAGGIPDK